MSNKIEIISDAHALSGGGNIIKKAKHSINHNNCTGRWLSTFMACWHPSQSKENLFVVGSMQQPRALEIFSGNTGKIVSKVQGDCLTAVMSRCCFHPSTERLIVMGGLASGRVALVR